jgi:WD40 repeat protein
MRSVVLALLTASSTAWRGVHSICSPHRHPRTRRMALSADPFDMSLLAQRMDEARERERADGVASLLAAAGNWRSGNCAQRTLAELDDWVRRVKRFGDVVACGTFSGDTVLIDLAAGEVHSSWEPYDEVEEDERPEITCIDWDGEHVSSGDSSGVAFFRRAGQEQPVLRVAHSKSVSGVHWTGGKRAYSCSLDGRLVCHDVEAQAEAASLSLRAPILGFSAYENYAAVGLADGSVVLCTLSPLRQLFAFDAHSSAATAVHLVTASQLLTGSADGEASLWRLDEDGDSDRRLTTYSGHRAPVVCVQGDGEKVVTGARDGTVRVWEAESGKMRFALQGFTAYLGSVQIAPTWLLADGTNDRIMLLDFSDEGIRQAEEEGEGDEGGEEEE